MKKIKKKQLKKVRGGTGVNPKTGEKVILQNDSNSRACPDKIIR